VKHQPDETVAGLLGVRRSSSSRAFTELFGLGLRFQIEKSAQAREMFLWSHLDIPCPSSPFPHLHSDKS
jgi:hypothetical protein